MENRWADSTSTSYLYGWRKLQTYLDSYHPPSGQSVRMLWCPLVDPGREYAWLSFLLWLRRKKPLGAAVNHESARKILVGVNAVFKSSGHLVVDFKGFMLFNEANKAWALATIPSKMKTPVTLANMVFIVTLADTDPLMVAICIFTWYTMARLAEVFSCLWGNITDLAAVVKFFLPRSKTDTARRGANLYVPTAIWSFILQLLEKAGVDIHSSCGRIFLSTPRKFRAWLKIRLPRATGHSFRRGKAQHLFDCLVPLDTIKRKGRWRSDAWMRYIDTTARDSVVVSSFALGILPAVELAHIVFH